MCDDEDERRPVPNPIVAPNGAYTIIALSREQADEAFRHFAPLVLCVDVPRAKYVSSTADAFRFFDGEA
jgi:hypothetical protein